MTKSSCQISGRFGSDSGTGCAGKGVLATSKAAGRGRAWFMFLCK